MDGGRGEGEGVWRDAAERGGKWKGERERGDTEGIGWREGGRKRERERDWRGAHANLKV
jgi:hypothetical protein